MSIWGCHEAAVTWRRLYFMQVSSDLLFKFIYGRGLHYLTCLQWSPSIVVRLEGFGRQHYAKSILIKEFKLSIIIITHLFLGDR